MKKLIALLVGLGLSLSALATDFDTIKQLAESGDAIAQNNVGLLYLSGQVVAKDNAQAVKWFEKSAQQGIPEAQYNLGLRYFSGQGVEQDYHQAFYWFEKAADANIAKAQMMLGVMYIKGHGVPKDYSIARQWLKKSCENDNQTACEGYRLLTKKSK